MDSEFVKPPIVQKIISKPILDIAARFWEDERYEAFKTCYLSLRIVDDLIDNRKAIARKITQREKQKFASIVNDWMSQGVSHYNSVQKKLVETREKFIIPIEPWQKFLESMIYDLDHCGFKTFSTFLDYTEGAAIAPGSIFMHLCGLSKNEKGFVAPKFDVMKLARPLATFSYLVHIVRDFQKDHKSNLNYFADDLIAENGLDLAGIRAIANGSEITQGFRALIGKYRDLADQYRKKSREMLDKTSAMLDPQYILSLEVLYSLYMQIFERIDPVNGIFTTAELNPSPLEVQERINQTVRSIKRGELLE